MKSCLNGCYDDNFVIYDMDVSETIVQEPESCLDDNILHRFYGEISTAAHFIVFNAYLS